MSLSQSFQWLLKDSGILFIGSSEMLSVYREYFDMEQYEEAGYIIVKEEVLKIMTVDDSAIVRKIIRSAVEVLDYEVVEAKDAKKPLIY